MSGKFDRAFRGSLLISATLLSSFAARAADTNNSAETVIVTAERRAQSVKEVPMSITVLGQDQLDKLHLRSLEDLSSQVPGLSLTEADPTHPDLILRGLNAGGDGSTVATYLDETPYGSSNALANGAVTAPNLDTFDMQRIEVLRGPQGTLYGASAEGGLIKFVTNAPDTSGFDDDFELSGIDMDHGGLGDSARGMLNLALADNFAVRVVGYDVRWPGYIEDPTQHASHVNDFTNFGGRAAALWDLTDKLSVRFNFLSQQTDTGNDSAEDVLLSGDSVVPKYGNYIQQRTTVTPQDVRYDIYNATINWDLDWATLTSATSFNELHDFLFQDGTGVLGVDISGHLHQGKFIQEIRLASPSGESPVEWLTGFYFANEHDYLHQDLVAGLNQGDILPGYFLQLDSKYVETAGFADLTWHALPNFDVDVGGRYSHNSQSSDEFGLALASGASTGDVFTWSVAAQYHLDEQTELYARVATGFRPGGPNLQPLGNVGKVPASYGADSVIDYEAGAKSDLPDLHLSFDADVFWMNWSHIQLLTVVNNTGVNGNGGTADSKGVEANIFWTPVERLTLNLNGAYTNAELTQNTDPILVSGLSGNPLPWTPKWSLTLNGDYVFQMMGEFTPYVGGSWHYAGARPSDFVPYLDVLTGQIPPAQYRNQFFMPSYNTLDLRAGVNWRDWSLELYGRNLNDAKGFLAFSPTGTSIASGNAASVSVMRPRVIGLVLRAKI